MGVGLESPTYFSSARRSNVAWPFQAEPRQFKSTLLIVLLALSPIAVHALDLHGFVDTRVGVRTQTDPRQDDESLGEVRLQLDAMRYTDWATFQLRSDLVYDWVANDTAVDLDEGDGWIDLREANLQLSPTSIMDLKVGRQILTWGTGDLVFINDLFPKDWVSFFSGRDEEYLKAPSDAVFISLFPSAVNIDIAVTPQFDADRFLTGERISFFGMQPNTVIDADVPDDPEVALRLSRTVGGYELAGYGYSGSWKSPAGMDPATDRATFPDLNVVGASARGQLGPGIVNTEVGFYDSEDSAGNDPLIRNSEVRALIGYQRELARDLSATAQYYLEHMLDHDEYRATSPEGITPADEDRHLLTLRLTRQLMNQNLTLSLFTFYSPSDSDGYVRPMVSYKATDNWRLTAGGNIFAGNNNHTFFGQFEDNSNIYAGARYSF